jgi:hypothetical protein
MLPLWRPLPVSNGLDWEAGDDFDRRASWVRDALAEARRRLTHPEGRSAARRK